MLERGDGLESTALGQAFRPDAIVLQCGSDAVTEDPQSRLSLSNNAHIAYAAALRPMSPRFLVLGGGGYNPWSVGRCWTSVWATLNGFDIPDVLPDPAQTVLRALTWDKKRFIAPPEDWVTTLRDIPRGGPINAEVRARITTLRERDLWT